MVAEAVAAEVIVKEGEGLIRWAKEKRQVVLRDDFIERKGWQLVAAFPDFKEEEGQKGAFLVFENEKGGLFSFELQVFKEVNGKERCIVVLGIEADAEGQLRGGRRSFLCKRGERVEVVELEYDAEGRLVTEREEVDIFDLPRGMSLEFEGRELERWWGKTEFWAGGLDSSWLGGVRTPRLEREASGDGKK